MWNRNLLFVVAVNVILLLNSKTISTSFRATCLKIKIVLYTGQIKCNLGQKVCRLFHVLVLFLFTTGETEVNYYNRKWMYELPHELPNDLRYGNLRNSEISGKSVKCLDLMVSTQPATQEANFGICAKNHKKSAIKHSIEKPILLNFVNLFTIFCPRL